MDTTRGRGYKEESDDHVIRAYKQHSAYIGTQLYNLIIKIQTLRIKVPLPPPTPHRAPTPTAATLFIQPAGVRPREVESGHSPASNFGSDSYNICWVIHQSREES